MDDIDLVNIFIVYDNNVWDKRLKPGWGFSCVLKFSKKTILFDTGGNGSILLYNIRMLDIKPEEIDVIILSHIHGDHVGGMADFLSQNRNLTVYLPKSFPQKFKDGVKSYGSRVIEVLGATELFENVYTSGELDSGMKEQSLIVKTTKGLVIVTGCAHPGIVNILKKALEFINYKIYMVLGGFHIIFESTSRIKSIIEGFKELGVKKVAPCHCTRDKACRLFMEQYYNNYISCGVGKKITIKNNEKWQNG